jgi:hypothetical protein
MRLVASVAQTQARGCGVSGMSTTGMFPNSNPRKPEKCAECERLLVALEAVTHVIAAHQAVAIAKAALRPPKEGK